ncbi:MAG TPA: LysM peptidoglycan-binding domain-containing protein [Anaerolineae bacterium]|nr:LysM peptidoglycan-binding domain-containing protein [Anaerolineae bacterium]HQI86722.1 LysM peptidoglycan-binding domain-containing protein [Anaerolineae bacterium]
MNAEAIVVLFLIVIGMVWAFWLIFKRDLMKDNLGKLLGYFAGVIITLLIVLWITSRFLPWWAVRLVVDTQQSQDVRDLQRVVGQLVNNPGATVPPTQVPTIAPIVTVSPVVTPENSSSQSLFTPGVGERTYVVRSGDTLYRISQNTGVSVERLKQRNNLNSDLIVPGQQLIIP